VRHCRRRAERRSLVANVTAAVLAGALLALLIVRLTAVRTVDAGDAEPSIIGSPVGERTTLADGARGDGGYEASLR